ncbi:Ig-like domain-containing protein [Pseudomonas parakoreensis]|uniref:Ig-like domain-containing protein n=1 Tax=Pseudomonas parakoreensis TaxID=2892331 RepID=UPI003FCF2372
MLVQPKRKISAPHSLLDPIVLGRLLPSGQWGINRAAVFTFPDLGLPVVIPVWANKAVGDTVKLLLDGREVHRRTIIDEAELKQPTLLWVAPRHLQTGSYPFTYEIKQPNQNEERPDKPLNLFVKLELPGGQDIDPGPGHSNLYMYIPPEIVNGGVDKDVAEAGVPIVIRSESGSGLPYPDIAEGDVIHLSWGGFFEYSTPVTLEQINDPAANPILITVSKATIKEAGDTDLSGLAVSFKVRDIVGNESEDWCKEIRIVVTTDIDLLAAPIVQEAVNNKLDADKQGDNDITVHVTATQPDFEMDDIIHLTMLGTTLEGQKVEVTALPQTVDNIPHNYEFKLSIAAVRKLVNTQVSFFYRLERSGSSDPLRSKRQFVQVTGAAHRLAAPIIEEAEGDFIDPTKTPINVRIPFDPAIEYGMGIELFLLGKRPDGSTFLPELEWHIPEEDEVENPEGFVITVDDYNLKLLDGGTLKGWYNLLIAEGDEILRRESLHTRLLNVGEPKFELDAAIVLGVVNGFLDPVTLPGGTSRLTIPRPVVKPWVANDEATWRWVGDISGEEPGSRTFNAVTAQQDWVINLDAAFVAQHIEPNRGSKITVRYQLWRHATDQTSLSNPLVFTVGVALDLLAPWIKENNGDSALNPLLVRDTLTIVVPDNTALLPNHAISVTWTGADGTPAGGSHTSVPRAVSEGLEFAIPNSVVAFSLGKQVKVSYVVIIDGHPKPSREFDLTVQAMPQSALASPTIEQAENDGTGPELHTGNLTQASVRMGDWPLIALDQYVWLHLYGINADGSAYVREIWSAPTAFTNPGWIADRFFTFPLPADELKALRDGSSLALMFKAALGQSTVESEAVGFPVRTYTIKAIEDVRPEITGVEDSKGNEIAKDGFTVDTQMTLSGAGAKGQKVQIKDGNTVKDEATVNLTTGLWELTMTGLSLATHTFTAIALYGSGQVSAAWKLTVTANTAPTITHALNSQGIDIPPGQSTVDTTVKLKGGGAKGQKVQIKDGTTVKGEADVDPTTGLWEWTMTDLSVGDHHFTATALYGEGKISEARTLKIIPKPIIIDPAIMVLGGVRLINDYGWARKPTTNTVKWRVATGGVAPYTYTSANSAIASVSNNGTVTGFRQGSTTITVTDKNGDQGQFTVRCNEIQIYKVVKSPGRMAGTYEAITGWIRSVGGITEAERVRKLADNFNDEYPDARIVLGPPYPAYPASNLLSWGYYASFPEIPKSSMFLNAMPPPNVTLFFTNSAYVNEQRVPGYVYALVPV